MFGEERKNMYRESEQKNKKIKIEENNIIPSIKYYENKRRDRKS